MKIITLVVVGLMLFGGIALARDFEEICETGYDTLRGVNNDCPLILNPYIAKTWEDVLFNKKADVRVELGYEFDSHKLANKNQVNVKFGLEF